jgi:hypothetical protein
MISNDLSATAAPLETIYQKRWKVEVFHKSIKLNTSMAKSPARTVRTQSNPVFMSLYATARLEILSAQQGLNKFALKSKLYINAFEGTIGTSMGDVPFIKKGELSAKDLMGTFF